MENEAQEDGSGVVDTQTSETNTDNVEQTQQTERSFLPEEYRGDKSFETYKDLSPILKTYKEQEKSLGRAVAFVPDEKATTEQWDKFYNKIGRPEKADSYAVPEKELPEGYQRDETFINNARKMAHEVGLRPEQFNALFDVLEQSNIDYHNQQKQLDDDFDKLLDKHMGEKGDEALKIAVDMASKYLPEELRPALQKLDNQGMVAMAIALKGIHDDYVKSDVITDINKGTSNAEEKKAEYFKLREDMENLDHSSDDYKKLLSKRVELAGQIGKTVVDPF